MELEIIGERIVLSHERAMLWPKEATLFLSDPHFGKASHFRVHGIPVPAGSTEDDVARIERLSEGIERIVILGDFFHAPTGRQSGTMEVLAAWCKRMGGKELLLVRGNHDERAGDPDDSFGIRAVDGPFHVGPFVLTHHPHQPGTGYCLSGHLHPGVRIESPGAGKMKLPCFVVGARRAILPAFGTFTGIARVKPLEGDRFYVVGPEQVFALP